MVLRFNFRGVGSSAGTWDNGRGEMDDYRAAVAYMGSQYPDLEIWAAGFSFGSYVATTVGADDDRVCALIAIAPPVDKYEFAAGEAVPQAEVHHPRRATTSSFHSSWCVTSTPSSRNRRSSSKSTAPTTCSTARRAKSGTRWRICWRISHARRSNRRRRADRGRQGAQRLAPAPSGPTRWPPPSSRRCSGARRASSPRDIDDVILGCAMPEAEQGLNVARIASLRAGIPVEASAVTINRFCSSGLQSIAFAAERIMCGFAQLRRRRRHRVDEHGADGRQQGRPRTRRWSTTIPTST